MAEKKSIIPLASVIENLRAELMTALQKGAGQDLQFRLQPIELELKVGVTAKGGGDGKVSFWVIELGASGEYERATTHTLKVVLEVVGPTGESPLISAVVEDDPM